MKIIVKKIGEDSGFCREYFKGIDNNRTYARQQEFRDVYKWYTTTKDGEPECNISDDVEFEIIGNWEEEQEKEFDRRLEEIRRKARNEL